VVVEDRRIFNSVFSRWIAVDSACLYLVAFFHCKIYLGIRHRKLNEISQIDVLVKRKLETKVARTTGLLTAAFISSFIPIFVFGILGNVVPFFLTNAATRFTQILAQFNSLFNPLFYCYRDHRFGRAIRELLGMKKPQAIQSAVGAAQFFRREDSITSLELPKLGKRMQRLERSASCNLTDTALYSIHGTPSVVMLKEALSVPTLDTCNSSLDRLDLQRPSSIVEKRETSEAR